MRPLYWLCYTAAKIAAKLLYGFRVVHPERIIDDGPALIVCNHTSFFDAPCVSIAFKRPIHFLARKTLFRKKLFGSFIGRLNAVPVDQDRPGVSSFRRIIALLKSGERVLIFPEGARSRDGEIGAAQPGVGFVIARSRARVLPVRVFGAYEAFPRRAKLPRLGGRVTVVAGEPIDFAQEIADGRRGKDYYQELSDRILAAIAALQLPGGKS